MGLLDVSHSQPYFLSNYEDVIDPLPEDMEAHMFFKSDFENLFPKIVFDD